MRRKTSNFWFYLLINIIVSALTTIIILVIWNAREQKNPAFSLSLTPISENGFSLADAEVQLPTLPALDVPTLEIKNVYGNGDIQTEFIQIQMVGSDELWLTKWQIVDSHKHVFTFPRLQLNSAGTVNVYTKLGVDSVTDLYWGETEPLWNSGETIKILDSSGNIRTEYLIP